MPARKKKKKLTVFFRLFAHQSLIYGGTAGIVYEKVLFGHI